MKLLRDLNKHKYIKEIKYFNDKSIKISYHHEKNFKPSYLVNDNHVFYSGGYRTILTSENKKETINPLNLKSAYPVEKFQTAIETKVIKDVFSNLKTDKIDLVKLLLMANLLIGVALLYYQFMGGK